MVKKADEPVKLKKLPKAKITKEKDREWLRVMLTDKEMMEAAKDSATSLIKKKNLEEQLDGIKKKFKSDIEHESLKMSVNSQKVEDGYEYRTVDCMWTKDWELGVKHLTRLDTNEVIKKDVKIEGSERQTTI